MHLNAYIMLILKSAYKLNAVNVCTPEYVFEFKLSLRLIKDTHTTVCYEHTEDSDDMIDTDDIIVPAILNVSDILYTPEIKKITGYEMTSTYREWSIENKNGITAKDLLEVMVRLKPRRLILKERCICPIRKINTNVLDNTIEIYFYY